MKNKGKSGIGAWLYRRYNDTKTTGAAGEKIQTVTHTLTNEMTRNEFGAAFAKAYGTRELRETGYAAVKLGTLSYVSAKFLRSKGRRQLGLPVSLLA